MPELSGDIPELYQGYWIQWRRNGNRHRTGQAGLASQELTLITPSEQQITISKDYAKQAYLACAFLLVSDRNQYGKLMEDLGNNFIQGQDQYPKTNIGAYNLLVHWKQNPQNLMRAFGTTTGDGIAFANVGKEDMSHWQTLEQRRTTQGSCVSTVVTEGTTQTNVPNLTGEK